MYLPFVLIIVGLQYFVVSENVLPTETSTSTEEVNAVTDEGELGIENFMLRKTTEEIVPIRKRQTRDLRSEEMKHKEREIIKAVSSQCQCVSFFSRIKNSLIY